MTRQSQRADAPFVAQCVRTDARVATTTANEVVKSYRRRQQLMDTDIEWVTAEHRAVSQAPTSGGVVHVLRELDDYFQSGVPLGILAAAMSKQGQTVKDTLADVHDVRMDGSLWEPRSDHLRPV